MHEICTLKQNKGWGNKTGFHFNEQPDEQGVMSKGKMKVTASRFLITSIFQSMNSVFSWVKSTVQSVH